MHGYITRLIEEKIHRSLSRSPATAILGPRQCGKSTTARMLLKNRPSIYLDLQDRVDRNKLAEPELFFDRYREKMICLDEIQMLPEFFSVLRSEIDKDRRPGRFLILGSASRDLIRQSTETLAGRIAYLDLSPFLIHEVSPSIPWSDLWLRGGFPESTLAKDDADSFDWRLDFIRTFMERDIFDYKLPLLCEPFQGRRDIHLTPSSQTVSIRSPIFRNSGCSSIYCLINRRVSDTASARRMKVAAMVDGGRRRWDTAKRSSIFFGHHFLVPARVRAGTSFLIYTAVDTRS